MAHQHIRNARQGLGEHVHLDPDALTRQVLRQQPARIRAVRAVGGRIDHHHAHQIGLLQEGQGRAHRDQCLGTFVPADGDLIGGGQRRGIVGHHQHRGLALEQRRLQRGFQFGAAILAIGFGQDHQIGEPRMGRHMAPQIGNLGDAAIRGPANAGSLEQVARRRFDGLGFRLCEAECFLKNHRTGASIVIPGLAAIDAKAEHVVMGILRPGQRDSLSNRAGGQAGIGQHGQQRFIGHLGTPVFSIGIGCM